MKTTIIHEINNPSDFFIQTKGGFIYHIREGTGDNLQEEDIDDGYVDYIYYDYYASLLDLKEDSAYDGGMILLKKLYKDMTIAEIISKVEEFEDVEFNRF